MTLLGAFLAYAIVLTIALALNGHRARFAAPCSEIPKRPVRVLVVGATGGTGRQLVAQALERGYEVTALARNPARLPVEHPRLTIVRGDVLDEAGVATVMRGHDAVLSALGHKRYFYPTRIQSLGTVNILRAMEAQGVRRFVCASSLGLGESVGRLGVMYTFFVIPVVLPFYFWDKTRQERAIAASRVEWVIVRPGALTNGGMRGLLQQGLGIGSLLWTVRVSRADVASFMLDQLESNTYVRTAPGVCW